MIYDQDHIPSPLDLLSVLVADPGLVDQHPDATGGVGLGQPGQVLAVLRVRLETHLEHRFESVLKRIVIFGRIRIRIIIRIPF